MEFDIEMADHLLATTRAVRKRLDLSREVPREIINECLELAVQAPTGGNTQGWRWVVVDDADKRAKLAELYAKGASGYLKASAEQAAADGNKQNQRAFSSAQYLADHLAEVPVHVIPCLAGRPPENTPTSMYSGLFGSIYPAIWSFQLALRARGLGSTLTSLHLAFEKQAAQVLGLPDDILQVALLPVAYTLGTDFKRAQRPPVSEITHWNTW
ncbi:MAG: nitroreductase [Gammaproteobacteria bacterium]|nr:nitroreductase [Gammaproteobacteria bacterium]